MKQSATITFFLVFLLSVSGVHAIGISPPSYSVEYVPGETYVFDFAVRNNAGQYREASISLKGAMSEYVTLSDEKIAMSAGGIGTFTATYALPSVADDLRPGKNEVEIYVREIIPSSGGFVAGTGVIASLYVFIPYPGQYAEIRSFTVADGRGGVNEGEDVPVTFSIINRGKEDLFGTQAEILMQDQTGNTIDRIRYENINLPSGMQYTESFSLATATTPPGDYSATLYYSYAGKRINITRAFTIGNFSVELTNYSRSLEQDGIVPFKITAKNRWKGHVYVNADVLVSGTSIAKSSREKVTDFRSVDLEAFIDTAPLALGMHNATITLTSQKVAPQYSGETISETFTVAFELIKAKKPAKESPFASLSPLTILLGVLVVLLISTLALFIVLLTKKKK